MSVRAQKGSASGAQPQGRGQPAPPSAPRTGSEEEPTQPSPSLAHQGHPQSTTQRGVASGHPGKGRRGECSQTSADLHTAEMPVAAPGQVLMIQGSQCPQGQVCSGAPTRAHPSEPWAHDGVLRRWRKASYLSAPPSHRPSGPREWLGLQPSGLVGTLTGHPAGPRGRRGTHHRWPAGRCSPCCGSPPRLWTYRSCRRSGSRSSGCRAAGAPRRSGHTGSRT